MAVTRATALIALLERVTPPFALTSIEAKAIAISSIVSLSLRNMERNMKVAELIIDWALANRTTTKTTAPTDFTSERSTEKVSAFVALHSRCDDSNSHVCKPIVVLDGFRFQKEYLKHTMGNPLEQKRP